MKPNNDAGRLERRVRLRTAEGEKNDGLGDLSIPPNFDFEAECNPILTRCPRCKNPHHKCDDGGPNFVLDTFKGV